MGKGDELIFAGTKINIFILYREKNDEKEDESMDDDYGICIWIGSGSPGSEGTG